ncbi:hypothetical protein CDO87_12500 [Sagittula sp. P11]|uniref:hypothetical protein n=1 Tax=Sagittula sp. P11 TaxID=2009329 RepID=UPI000C2D458E|nr:hypothetical protein [Sagittula sp. P11]AUC53951.1 hypothetical protein CDO87_12500 [Sagittula sp. P11]
MKLHLSPKQLSRLKGISELTKADLRGADLSDVDLQGIEIDSSHFNFDHGLTENTAREEIEGSSYPTDQMRQIVSRIDRMLRLVKGVDGLMSIVAILEGKSEKRRARVHMPPGTFARSLLSFVFSKKAFETVFAQAIVDMRDEHTEALARSQTWKAKWIVIRDHMNLSLTVAFYVATSLGKKVIGIWKMIP